MDPETNCINQVTPEHRMMRPVLKQGLSTPEYVIMFSVLSEIVTELISRKSY